MLSSDQDRGFVAPRRARKDRFARRVRNVFGGWRRPGVAAVAASLLATCATAQGPAVPGAERAEREATAAEQFWARVERNQNRCAADLYIEPEIGSNHSFDRFLACLNASSDPGTGPALPADVFGAAVGLLQGNGPAAHAEPMLVQLIDGFPASDRSRVLAALQATCEAGTSAVSLLLIGNYLNQKPFPSGEIDFNGRCTSRESTFNHMLRACVNLGRPCIESGMTYVTTVMAWHRWMTGK
jgi:hypothetical protein